MTKTRSILSSGFIAFILAAGTLFAPLTAYAQEAPADPPVEVDPVVSTEPPQPESPALPPPAEEPIATPEPALQQTAPPTNVQGPTSPTGAESRSYNYNPITGLWENDYYTWNPITKQTKPKNEQPYSYNPSTGRWDTTEWVYDAPSGSYQPNVRSTPNLPAGAAIDLPPELLRSLGISDAGEQSGLESSCCGTGIYDLFFNGSISNSLNSNAQSGNVSILQNTSAGNALSGDAAAIANIINLLQSSWAPEGGNFTTFISNIDGDVFGDLMVDPGYITKQPLAVSDCCGSDVDINIAVDGLIDNDITLIAGSGDVGAGQNTRVGDASSGNALAVANVTNMINSLIGANESFLGVININGNLNGDILMPPELLHNLIASNSPDSDQPCSSCDSSLGVNLNDNQTINNNVSAAANSGDVSVTRNTMAGNAESGDARTKVTILNLTGRSVIGRDALLVFVNVLGEWVGLIMNAPPGSTAAAIGSADSTSSFLPTGDTEMDVNTNSVINNDINVLAESGDVNVYENTTAGNAKSGNALAAINLLNITNSQFALSDWFGILFINILGNWHGSFGVDTEAGEPPAVVPPAVAGSPGGSNSVFSFVSRVFGGTASAGQEEAQPTVTEVKKDVEIPIVGTASQDSGGASGNMDLFLWTILPVLVGLLLLSGERLYTFVRSRESTA